MPRRQVSWYRTTCTPKRAGCTASATTAPPRQASWRRGQRNLKAAWALRWCRSVPISRQLRRQEAREDRDSKGDCREQESELCGKKKTKASGLLSSREAECGKRKSEFIQKDAHGSQHESQEAQKKKKSGQKAKTGRSGKRGANSLSTHAWKAGREEKHTRHVPFQAHASLPLSSHVQLKTRTDMGDKEGLPVGKEREQTPPFRDSLVVGRAVREATVMSLQGC